MQVAYVFTNANNLQTGLGNNNVTQLFPAVQIFNRTSYAIPGFQSWWSYQRTIGASNYNGLQTKLEQQFSKGLNFLATYT